MSQSDPPQPGDLPVLPSEPRSGSDPQFRAVFDYAPDGMLVLDSQGRFTEINRAACALLRLPPEVFLGQSVFADQGMVSPATLAQMWRALLEEGQYRGELRLHRADGSTCMVEITAVANVPPDQHLVVIRDITQRHHAEEALRASEERFARAFRASPDAVSITHLFTGRIIEVNDHWVAMIGYSRAEAVGRLLTDLGVWVGPGDPELVRSLLRAHGLIHELELGFRKKSGEVRAGLLSVELIELDGNLCALSIQRDITERKRAEEALRQSEERFAKAFRATPYAASITSLADGRLLDVNEIWVEVSGYSREETLGRTVAELNIWSQPEDRQQMVALLRAQGTVRDLDIRLRTKSGQLRRFSLSAEVIDLAGEECLLSMGLDVTEQRAAEAALRQSADRLAQVFRATPTAISVTRLADSSIVDVNDSWLRMAGYQRAEVIGRRMTDLNVWHDAAVRERLFAQLQEQGSFRDVEMLFRRRSGEVRQGLISVELIDQDGEPCALVMTQDVTDHKQVAGQLRLLGAAVQHASDVIMITDAILDSPGPRIVFVNTAFTRLTGYSADEVRGQTPRLLQGPKTDRAVLDQLHAQLSAGQAAQGEAINYRKDGSDYRVEWHITPITNALGVVTHWMALERDITEQRELEERMRAAERLGALGRVAAGVAHEFNNILAGIMGRLDLLEMEIHEPGAQATLAVIQRAVEDGANVVKRIQAFSRLRAGGEFTAVPLSGLVQDVIAMTQTRWQVLPAAKGFVISMRSQVEQGLMVQGDPTELREVLTNLIYNAVEAMPGGGQLTIHAEGRGAQVILTVRDSGVGMDADTQERAFEPFFTTKVSGTGLGLAVVKDIIHRHGGTIRIVSVPGGGTAITLELPSATARPLALPLPTPPPVAAGSGRILVVDDDPGLGGMLRQMLVLAGHEVQVAGSGPEALSLIEQYPFDLICTDLGMPGMNGWEVARAVRQRAPGTPIALVTGWGTELDPMELARNTVDFVLPKPYRVAQVQQLVAQALAQPKEESLHE